MNALKQWEERERIRLTEKVRHPEFAPGDTVRVSVRITEGERSRLQAFEGVCIAQRARGISSCFTVRKISHGEGVERVFPIYSPLVAEIQVLRRGSVRRAKLYYLRGRRGKSARIKADERRDMRDPVKQISQTVPEPKPEPSAEG